MVKYSNQEKISKKAIMLRGLSSPNPNRPEEPEAPSVE